MKIWLFYTVITACLWGVWGFFSKLASRSVTPKNLLLLGSLGGILVLPIYISMFYKQFRFEWNCPNYYYAILGGIAGSIGGVFFYQAISKGEISRIVVITAMYPIITVLLSLVILHERLTPYKIAGICFALIGLYFLSK